MLKDMLFMYRWFFKSMKVYKIIDLFWLLNRWNIIISNLKKLDLVGYFEKCGV